MLDEKARKEKIVLFDGVCNLCNGSVVFVLKHEKDSTFRFASIQSEIGKIHSGSTAALKIGQELQFPWSMLSSVGLVVPKLIRDRVYEQIAKHRYRWFGRKDVCMVPTSELKARFL